jgi:uncharacterized phage protein (TIGR02218 family)
VRDAPASIETMLGTTQLTLARCVKFVLRDGTEIGFTDHDQDLVVPLENDLYDPVTYHAGIGMVVGDMSLAVGLEADNTEMSFPLGELMPLTRANVLSRRFGMADCYIFDADWTQLVPQPLELMAGYIGEARPEKNMAVFEIRSNADRWNTVIGRLAAPRCTADFGDALCGATPTVNESTVLESLSNMRFRVDLAENLADDFYRFGTVEFTTGPLGGTWPYEIVAFDGYLQEVEVLSPMPGFPEVGDSVLLRNGCSRVKKADDPTVPTCLTHNNVLRFRGLDQLPGTDRYIRFPIPNNPGT